MWLWISILVLFLGPALYRAARSRPGWMSVLDGFLLVAIGGLVVLDVLPETLEQSGWVALLFVILGFLGPTLVEHYFRRLAHSAHRVAILLALLSLGLHALVDGAALWGGFAGPQPGFRALPLAVVLHRVPVGLTIWWLLKPQSGARVASSVLILIAAATAGGYFFGGSALVETSGYGLGLFQALVAGSLLHVIVHRTELHDHASITPRWQNRLNAVGGIAGVALLVGVLSPASTSEGLGTRVLDNFLRLALESAPALVLAYLLAGLMSVFLPVASVIWMSRGSSFNQALKGMVVGLPLPVCSCGVVPLFRSISQRGAPAAASVAFLIATPELSLDAVLVSFPLLGPEIAVARLVAAAAVALLVGVAVGLFHRRTAAAPTAAEPVMPPGPSPSTLTRLGRGLNLGLREIVDDTAPWIVVGLAVAALIEPTLSPEMVRRLPGYLEVPVFAALGIPMYVCASGATPLVAILLLKGISPGAAIAFLLTGPATNLTTFGVVSDTLGRRTATVFGGMAFLLAISSGWMVNALQPAGPSLQLGAVAEGAFGIFSWSALIILALLFGLSFFRQGPRNFLHQLGLPDTRHAPG